MDLTPAPAPTQAELDATRKELEGVLQHHENKAESIRREITKTEELIEDHEIFRLLIASPGWLKLEKIMDKHIETYGRAIEPTDSDKWANVCQAAEIARRTWDRTKWTARGKGGEGPQSLEQWRTILRDQKDALEEEEHNIYAAKQALGISVVN